MARPSAKFRDWLDTDVKTWTDLLGKTTVIVDGDNGVGKSTYIAPKIAAILKAKVISVDNHLLGNAAPYLEQIRYEDLHAEILASHSPVVVEGLCMVNVMAIIQVRFDYHVFVQRLMSAAWENGSWLRKGAKPPKSKTTKDLVQYYNDRRPFEICNKCVAIDPLDFVNN